MAEEKSSEQFESDGQLPVEMGTLRQEINACKKLLEPLPDTLESFRKSTVMPPKQSEYLKKLKDINTDLLKQLETINLSPNNKQLSYGQVSEVQDNLNHAKLSLGMAYIHFANAQYVLGKRESADTPYKKAMDTLLQNDLELSEIKPPLRLLAIRCIFWEENQEVFNKVVTTDCSTENPDILPQLYEVFPETIDELLLVDAEETASAAASAFLATVDNNPEKTQEKLQFLLFEGNNNLSVENTSRAINCFNAILLIDPDFKFNDLSFYANVKIRLAKAYHIEAEKSFSFSDERVDLRAKAEESFKQAYEFMDDQSADHIKALVEYGNFLHSSNQNEKAWEILNTINIEKAKQETLIYPYSERLTLTFLLAGMCSINKQLVIRPDILVYHLQVQIWHNLKNPEYRERMSSILENYENAVKQSDNPLYDFLYISDYYCYCKFLPNSEYLERVKATYPDGHFAREYLANLNSDTAMHTHFETIFEDPQFHSMLAYAFSDHDNIYRAKQAPLSDLKDLDDFYDNQEENDDLQKAIALSLEDDPDSKNELPAELDESPDQTQILPDTEYTFQVGGWGDESNNSDDDLREALRASVKTFEQEHSKLQLSITSMHSAVSENPYEENKTPDPINESQVGTSVPSSPSSSIHADGGLADSIETSSSSASTFWHTDKKNSRDLSQQALNDEQSEPASPTSKP